MSPLASAAAAPVGASRRPVREFEVRAPLQVVAIGYQRPAVRGGYEVLGVG